MCRNSAAPKTWLHSTQPAATAWRASETARRSSSVSMVAVLKRQGSLSGVRFSHGLRSHGVLNEIIIGGAIGPANLVVA